MTQNKWVRFYTSFDGRATRADFNLGYLLVMFIGGCIAFAMDWQTQGMALIDAHATAVYSNLWSLLCLWPGLAITCRRLHDLNYSGWWQGLVYALPCLFIVIVIMFFGLAVFNNPLPAFALLTWGVMALMVFYLVFYITVSCVRGTAGDNKYGADPLQQQEIKHDA